MKLIYIAILLLFFCVESLSAKALKKVTLQLSWFDQFQFAGYYIAKEKGFYKSLGLDVEFKPFSFGLDMADEVDKGKVNFAIGRETLILDRVKGKKIVALYALFQATPLVLLTNNNQIKSIEDFKNKRIMTTSDDSSEVSIKAMITSKKVKSDELQFIEHSHDINDLVNKKTDIISAYISKTPFDLKKMGKEFKIFDPKDYGFDMYSDFLFTSENMIDNHIDTVMAFKKASLQGWKYAYSNMEKTVDLIFDKYNSQNISKEALLYEAIELKKLSYHGTKDLGNIKDEKVQRIYDLYNVMGLTPNQINSKRFIYYEHENKKIFLTKDEKEYLKNNNHFKLCVNPNIKPYSYFEDKKFKGFVADYFKIIEEKTGIDFEIIRSNNFKNSFDLFKNNECEVFSALTNTNERREYAKFTKAYHGIPFVLISRQDFPFVENLSNLENKRIGIIGSYNISKRIKEEYPNLDYVYVKNSDEGIEKVLSRELDGHIDLLYTTLYKLYNKNNLELKISNKLDIGANLSIAVRHENPVLYEIINRAVDDIDDKKVDKLINSWITIDYERGADLTYLWVLLFIIGLVFLALIYRQKVLNQMNKSLNNKVKEKTEELIKINENLEKRIEKEVNENLKKDNLLQRQSKMVAMGEMLENIAHQWRQPLSSISVGASGIKIKKELDTLDDKFLIETLDSIVNSTSYLSQTIEDFRNFFKPNKEKKRFYVDRCFEKSLNILKSKFDSENIKTVKNIEELSILGHETELIQVFMNILNNARDALEYSKEDKKFIFVDIFRFKNQVVIKIKDNGGGINSSIIDKIFEPYFTTKHKSQGTGIGLYMSDQIITKHMNGLIEVSNDKFKYENNTYTGALFTITLYDE